MNGLSPPGAPAALTVLTGFLGAGKPVLEKGG